MNRAQWSIVIASILLVVVLYAATKNQFFGERKAKVETPGVNQQPQELTTDSILFYSKQNLTPEQIARLNQLENSISRGDVMNQKVQLYHQLAHFWADSAKVFAPYAYYTGEAARLVNSENSLTFAAHLFLDDLTNTEDPRLKQWEALQAKDLFERSLKLNQNNDSSKVGLGAVYLYGGLASPMEGIGMIRSVVEKDSGNVYAQMTLGKASLLSGQIDKAVERFKKVAQLHPDNMEAILLLADTYEKMGNNAAAAEWYQRSLPLISRPDLKQEVEKRITQLKK